MTRCWAAALLLASLCATARAATRTYVIAIGNDAPPAALDGDEPLPPLRYADDDAAAFFAFSRDLATRAALLTVLDVDSQARYPDVVAAARPPSLAELRRVLADYAPRFEADRRAGDDPVLLFFYSGHGSLHDGRAALTMLDGPLTQELLYDQVLAALPARYVHVFVDACHAEAVVRPRDVAAATVELSPAETESYVTRSTLARFPNVGAIIATTINQQTHEWDQYQHGVFTEELLSGLRGGADVNGDGRIEYSELAAFLAAANGGVADPRAHLSIIARPPPLDRRVAIVDLSALGGRARLVGDASALGSFHVEDARGNRLAELRAERGYRLSLVVPAGEELYVATRTAEARVLARDGGRIRLGALTLHRRAMERRGALESAMQHGLFAAAFGPIYYRAFVEQRREFEPVPLDDDDGGGGADLVAARPRLKPAYASFGVAASLGALALTFGGLAGQTYADWQRATLQRPAVSLQQRFYLYEGLAIGSAVVGGVAAAVGIGLTVRARRRAGR